MKFYDKELFKASNSIKTAIYMIIIFSIGFLAGYFTMKFENKNTSSIVANQEVSINSQSMHSAQF